MSPSPTRLLFTLFLVLIQGGHTTHSTVTTITSAIPTMPATNSRITLWNVLMHDVVSPVPHH